MTELQRTGDPLLLRRSAPDIAIVERRRWFFRHPAAIRVTHWVNVLCFILLLLSGYQIFNATTGILSDRIVMSDKDIEHVVMGVPGVLGCHEIRTRGSEDHVFLDLHVWLPADMQLEEAHRISHVVKDHLMTRYPKIADAIIHIEPPPRT